jgi:hypothetical protein
MSTSDSIPGEDSAPPSDFSMHLAYAEACVVLVECLMHVMVERKLVPKDELVAAVENAVNTKKAMADSHWHRDIAPVAIGVLTQLANSLRALS